MSGLLVVVIGARRQLVCLLLVLAPVVAGAGPAPRLVIDAPPELAAVAAQLEDEGLGDFSNILAITGRMGFKEPIRVVVAGEDSPLARETPGWVSGYARGDRGVVVLFPARVSSYPDRDLRQLLHHEVAHVEIYRAARGRPMPRWFNEGLATVAAREWGLEDRARYSLAVIGARPRGVTDLDAGFAAGGRAVRQSYALSSAFIRFLQRRYGAFAPARIIDGVAAGRSFDEAFAVATGSRLARAEWVFFEREAYWNTWVPFLTSSGALWMGITVLALVAIARRRRRSAALHEAWEAEEALEAVVTEIGPRESAGRADDVVN